MKIVSSQVKSYVFSRNKYKNDKNFSGKYERRVSTEAYYMYKLEHVSFWNGIDQYNIIINNHLYKFFIPNEFPIVPPKIEWYSCPR